MTPIEFFALNNAERYFIETLVCLALIGLAEIFAYALGRM